MEWIKIFDPRDWTVFVPTTTAIEASAPVRIDLDVGGWLVTLRGAVVGQREDPAGVIVASERAYCLVCDRWGLDHLLAGPGGEPATTARSRRSTPNAPSDAALAAARATRKEKHRRKMAERAAVERMRGKSI